MSMSAYCVESRLFSNHATERSSVMFACRRNICLDARTTEDPNLKISSLNTACSDKWEYANAKHCYNNDAAMEIQFIVPL